MNCFRLGLAFIQIVSIPPTLRPVKLHIPFVVMFLFYFSIFFHLICKLLILWPPLKKKKRKKEEENTLLYLLKFWLHIFIILYIFLLFLCSSLLHAVVEMLIVTDPYSCM